MPTTPTPPSPYARLRPPANAGQLAEWALVPLRAFLGFTFLYAGLQKLANPNFVNPKSPISIQQQLVASARISPLHSILTHLTGQAKLIGLVIAFCEVAIGLGTLVGFWTRWAALGGALLSFNLFLTVSFHASPYFTGADIVFFFAWLPFVIAGSGTRLSVDGWLRRFVAKRDGASASDLVAIPFDQVRTLCGHFNDGACGALAGAACRDDVCPVLRGANAPSATAIDPAAIQRRSVVIGATAAAAVGATTLILGGFTEEIGKLINNAPAPTTGNALGASSATTTTSMATTTTTAAGATTTTAAGATTTTTAVKGTLLGKASQVAEGHAATFTIPSSGDPGIVVHTTSGAWEAYDAVCPHAGCTVGYYAQNNMFVCPCHGSQFNLDTGAVEGGPAPHGLTKLTVVEASDGNLYLQ